MDERKLGRYLRGLRKSKGYTQEFVASHLGISRQAYSHYETSRTIPPNDICRKIADLYAIDIEALIELSLFPESFSGAKQYEPSNHMEDFLSYLENEKNLKKLRFLSAEEKELLYYFNHLSDKEQMEILEIMKIKLRLSN